MTKRLWPVFFISLCIVLPGCAKEEEPEPVTQTPSPVVAKPKKKPKPAPEPTSTVPADLMSFIPPSLSAAMGAKPGGLADISDKTGIDFAAELRPATLMLAGAGFQLADVEELWVGSNPATNDGAVCAKMVKQYDRAKLRQALHIGDSLGKIDGVELHVMPSFDGTENAVAFVDEKILMIGRRQTLEASLKKTTDGSLKSALAVAGAENTAYWVAGGPDAYVQLLAFHGFSGFMANADANVPPVGFALAFSAKSSQTPNRPAAALNRNVGGKRRHGRDADNDFNQQIGIGRHLQLPRGKDRDKDDDKDKRKKDVKPIGFGRQMQRGINNNAAATRSTGTLAVTFAFTFENEQQTLRMERRVRSVMDNMPEKLKTAASYNVAWTDSTNDGGPVGAETASHSIGRFGKARRDLLNDLSREFRPAENPTPEQSPVLPQVRLFWSKDKDKGDKHNRGGQRGPGRQAAGGGGQAGQGNKIGFGIRPPANHQKIDPGMQFQTVNVAFQYEVSRDKNNLRVQVDMDLPRSMVSVAAAVRQAVGGTLTGGGMYPGTLTTISAAMNFWSAQTRGNRRGVKMVPDMPVLGGYSWMTELLPYVGRPELYGAIDFNQSWITHPENYRIAGTVIPEFLNPAAGNAKWQGYPYNGLGLTHFVGMSGVEDGPNVVAAALKRSDPRAGFFGYNDIAKPREITDGAGKTIMLIGSGRLAGPWIQGGGATIRGAREPYFDEISGFHSPGLKTPGTVVLFADGSSREISADIAPEVFRAMCTIHGAETVDIPRGQPPQTGLPMPTPTPTPSPSSGNALQSVINFFKPDGK